MSNENDKSPQRGDIMRGFAGIAEVAVHMVACVAIGVFLGWGLDRLLGTSPWLLLACSLLGAAAAIKAIFSFRKKM